LILAFFLPSIAVRGLGEWNLLIFISVASIRKVQETQVGLKLNGTHQLLAYADDVNLLGYNIDSIQKNTLIDASKEAGLEINIKKILYMCCLITRMEVKIRT
jgi:aryl carrier-like protein